MLWRTLLCCLVLAGTVSAGAWEPLMRHQYAIRVRTLTALPDVAGVYTGSQNTLKLDITTITPHEYTGKITKASDASISPVTLPDAWTAEIPPEELHYQPIPISQKVFYVQLNDDGTIREVNFELGVEKWEQILTRGILNQLQVAPLAGHSRRYPFVNPPTSKNTNFSIFHRTEKSIQGECDVVYEINPVTPADVLRTTYPLESDWEQTRVITKNWNFTNCKRMNKFVMGLSDPQNFDAGSNAQGPISRSSKSRIVIVGDLKNFTIVKVETNSSLSVAPQLYNNQKGLVVTSFSLNLLTKSPSKKPLSKPRLPVRADKPSEQNVAIPEALQAYMKDDEMASRTTSPYQQELSARISQYQLQAQRHFLQMDDLPEDESLEWLLNVPMPYGSGAYGKRVIDVQGRNASEILAEFAEDIARGFNNHSQILSGEPLSKMIIMVKQVRTAYLPEILEAHRIINDNLSKKILRKAVAMSGTPHGLEAIYIWVKTEEIEPQEATQHIAVQRYVTFAPNRHHLFTLRDIAVEMKKISEKGKEGFDDLYAVSILTFTDMLRMTGVRQHKYRDITNSTVQYLAKHMAGALEREDSSEAQLHIRALGNIADKTIVEVFKPYLNGSKRITEFLRLVIYASMDQLSTMHPKSMSKYWYTVYSNASLPHQARCIAVQQLMNSRPSGRLLQQLAEDTHNETSTHVKALVISMIKDAAKLRGPHNAELARNAKAAVTFLSPEEFDASASGALLSSFKIPGTDLSYTQFLSYVGSNDHLLPSIVQKEVYQNHGGYRTQAIKALGMVSSVNDTIEAIRLALEATKLIPLSGDNDSDDADDADDTGSQEVPEPFEDIHVRRRQKLEGNVYIPGHLFWAFDEKILENKIIDAVRNFAGDDIPVETIKITNRKEVMFGTVNEIGLPLLFTLTSPEIIVINGTVNLLQNIQQVRPAENQQSVLRVKARLNFTHGTREESKLGFWTPWNAMDYIAGVDSATQVHLPADIMIDVSLAKDLNKPLNTTVRVRPQVKRSTNIFHHSTTPFVTKLWLPAAPTTTAANPNTTIVHVRSPVKSNVLVGKNATGMALRVEYSSEIDMTHIHNVGADLPDIKGHPWLSVVYRWAYQNWKNHDLFSMLYFPFATKDIHMSSLNVTYDPQESTAEYVTMTLAIGDLQAPAVSQRSSKSYRTHPRNLEMPAAIEATLQQQAEEEGTRGHQIQLNATFVGQTTAVFGVHGAVQTNEINQSVNSTVQIWGVPAVGESLNAAMDVSLVVPEVPTLNFRKALAGNPNSTVSASLLVSRPSWSKPSLITVTGNFDRTLERQEFIKESPMAKLCMKQMQSGQNIMPACQNVTQWANSLDQYKLSIRHKHLPTEAKRLLYFAYSVVRQALYYNVQEEVFEVDPSMNRIALALRLNNQSTAFNFSVESNTVLANGTHIPLPTWAKPLILNAGNTLLERIFKQIYPLYYAPSFVVDNGMIVTYDNHTYPLRPSKCWYVATAYAPKWSSDAPVEQQQTYRLGELPTFILIHRKPENNLLETKIRIGGHIIQMAGVQKQRPVKVLFDGEPVDVQQKQLIRLGETGSIHLLPGGEVVVNLKHNSHLSQIIQDPERLQVIGRNSLRENVVGLAGNADGEILNELVTPTGCVATDPELFEASWSDCKHTSIDSTCAVINNAPAFQAERISIQAPKHVPEFLKGEGDSYSSSSSSSESDEQAAMDVPFRDTLMSRLPELEGHISGIEGHLSLPEFGGHIQYPHGPHYSTVYQTDVQEFDYVTCFSVYPILKCKPGLIPVRQKLENVGYHCIPHGRIADMYKSKAQHFGHLTQFHGKTVDRNLMTLVPVECQSP